MVIIKRFSSSSIHLYTKPANCPVAVPSHLTYRCEIIDPILIYVLAKTIHEFLFALFFLVHKFCFSSSTTIDSYLTFLLTILKCMQRSIVIRLQLI